MLSAASASAPPPTTTEASADEELHRAWTRGDAAAGDALIRRHLPALRRHARRQASNHELGEEIVAITLLRLSEAPDRFRCESSFRSFMLGISNYVLLEQLRKRSKQARRGVELSHSLGDPTQFEDELLEHEATALLHEALASLSQREQQVLEFYYWKHYKFRQISQHYGTSVTTAHDWTKKAQRRLASQYTALTCH